MEFNREDFRFQTLIPINKNINPNQIHKDYSGSLQNVGKIIAFNQPTVLLNSISQNYFSGVSNKMNERKNEDRKKFMKKGSGISNSAREIKQEERLFYSKKYKFLGVLPSTSDNTRIGKPGTIQELDSYLIGTKKREGQRNQLENEKNYSVNIRKRLLKSK